MYELIWFAAGVAAMFAGLFLWGVWRARRIQLPVATGARSVSMLRGRGSLTVKHRDGTHSE